MIAQERTLSDNRSKVVSGKEYLIASIRAQKEVFELYFTEAKND